MRVKNVKPDETVDCWDCSGNNFPGDGAMLAKKDGDNKEKGNVIFRDDYDEDYVDGIILTCLGNHL